MTFGEPITFYDPKKETPAGASALCVGDDVAHATIAEPQMSRRGGDDGGRSKAIKDSGSADPSASPNTLAATTAAS